VIYYNRFACETQTFRVIAKDESDAERLFWIKHPKASYKEDCVENISEVNEEHYYTEEELLNGK
jgi:hypothetical protein